MRKVRRYHLDGINVDYTESVWKNSREYTSLTNLVKMLRKGLRRIHADSILSIVWFYCPTCNKRRTYDIQGLKQYVDYFMVMMTEMRTCRKKYIGLCKACSQDSFQDVKKYADQWMKVKGLQTDQVVIVLPWYGHVRSCDIRRGSKCYLDCNQLKNYTNVFVSDPIIITA